MNRFFNILFALVLLGFLYSCTPPLYIPNTTNVPVLKKQGDLHMSYTAGTNGHDLQGAFAVSDKVGLMVNTSFANEKSSNTTTYHKHSFVEAGAGTNVILNKGYVKSDKDLAFMFTGYGGAGIGKSSGLVSYANVFDPDITYNSTVQGNYFRIFGQPAIGLTHKNVDFFFAYRVSFVNVYALDLGADNAIQGQPYNIFHEPTFTLRLGSKNVKFFGQGGLSLGQNPERDISFRQRPVIFVIGIHLNFNTKKGSVLKEMPAEAPPVDL